MKEVVPGVFEVPIRVAGLPYVNAFVIAEDAVTVVDTGLPKRAPYLLRLLGSLGRRPQELRDVLVTHHHVDHTGSLAALLRETGARVHVHPQDAPIVRGERPAPPATRPNILTRLLEPVAARRGLTELEPARETADMADGDELPVLGGLRVVHTPGHTPGHVSFLSPSRRLLFAGDAAGSLLGRVGLPLGAYTEDMAWARRSIAALAELDFDVACFGHGPSIRGAANARFRSLVEKLAR